MQQDGETGSGSDDTILKKPVLAALAAVGLIVFLSSLGAGTTLAPNWVNTTGGDLSEVGSLDGGGNTVQVTDNVSVTGNNISVGTGQYHTNKHTIETTSDQAVTITSSTSRTGGTGSTTTASW